MAHFAEIDSNNIVTQVVVVNNDILLDENGAEQESLGIAFLHNLYGSDKTWVQTSYHTHGNEHRLGGTPFRKNYAGVGFTWDSSLNGFIRPCPWPSWQNQFNSEKGLYEPPLPRITDGYLYIWDEDLYQSDNTQGWVRAHQSPIWHASDAEE